MKYKAEVVAYESYGEANVEPENTCCTCYYHDAKSWFCYNGLSPKGTENTDPEDTCEFYEKRSECES